ncbi:HAD family hydrolase [Rhodopila sp.]|uniref:HAD family hydrolase n=1 Tax=Rhodopila sp. TaxID=2480087 RepID=UPI003D0DC19F
MAFASPAIGLAGTRDMVRQKGMQGVIKAAIFDVDGTLVDSVDQHAKSWEEAFRDFGHVIPFADVRSQIGKGGDQLMPVFLTPAELDATGDALDKQRSSIMKERYLATIKAFPDVRALFQRLRDDGVQVVLASSAKSDELKIYKRLADIDDLVDAETSSDDAEKSKPHPDIFEAALARLPGIDPSEAVVVGDTPYDAEAAAKVGLATIGILTGGFPESALRRAGCIEIFADPADLLKHYHRSPFARGKSSPAA